MNTLSGYSKLTLSDKYVLTAAGGHLAVGNADKNIPLNNGVTCTNLKAQYSVSAEMLSSTYSNKNINFANNANELRLISDTSTSAKDNGYPDRYCSGLSVMTNYTGWLMVTYGSIGTPNPYFRSFGDDGRRSDWKQLAFIDNIPTKTSQLTNDSGYVTGGPYLPSASYTAADILNKLKTVDGTGSGLDADTLDGLNSSSFLLKSLYGFSVDTYTFNVGSTATGWIYLGYFYGNNGGIKIECDYTSHCGNDYGICSSHLTVGVRPYTLLGFISKVKGNSGGLYITESSDSGYKYYHVYIYLGAWWQGLIRIQALGSDSFFTWTKTATSPNSSYSVVLDTRTLDGYYVCHKGVLTNIYSYNPTNYYWANVGVSTTSSNTTTPIFGSVRIGGTKTLGSAWKNGLVVGPDGTNKVVITYLASSTNGATIGAHNSALTAWADLNISGANLYFRINESIKMTLNSLGLLLIPKSGASSSSGLVVGGSSAAISTAIADQTSMIQVVAGSGGNTNSTAIGFHNPGISSAVLEYRNTNTNTGSFNFRSDDTTWGVGIGTTSPVSKLHVKGITTIDAGINALTINHNHTLSSAWNDFIRCINPNLTSTYHTAHITFGLAYNSKNVGYIGFKYTGSGSNSNLVTIGLHSVDNILNITAAGNVGIGLLAPDTKLHINGNLKIQGTSNTSTKPDIYLGHYTSWGGGTYPTLMSGYTSQWIMHFNPHICRSTSTDMPGSNIRMESISSKYFDISVGRNSTDIFQIRYNNSKDLITVSNTGQINLINGICFSGTISSGGGTYMIGNSTGLFLAANESGRKLYLESTNQSCPYFRNSSGDFPIIHSNNWHSYIGGLGYVMREHIIDATSLNADTWYPVTMPIGSHPTVRIEVRVSLNSGSKPSWSTHGSGFSVRKIWEVNGSGWGTNSVNRTVIVSDYLHASTDPVRGIGDMGYSSTEYVYVRGGGKYFFYTSHNVTPTLRSSTYVGTADPYYQAISPTTTAPGAIAAFQVNRSMYASHFYENSDAKLKENINLISSSDNIPLLKEFDWKSDGKHSYGLIAQELEAMGYSELVEDSGDHKTVNYSAALSLIVGKLQVKIRELEKEIENLKNKN